MAGTRLTSCVDNRFGPISPSFFTEAAARRRHQFWVSSQRPR
ncbi:MAG: hypothetical protein Q8P67_14885 [archaeon]|nr:hypothetical protein [archaeon]